MCVRLLCVAHPSNAAKRRMQHSAKCSKAACLTRIDSRSEQSQLPCIIRGECIWLHVHQIIRTRCKNHTRVSLPPLWAFRHAQRLLYIYVCCCNVCHSHHAVTVTSQDVTQRLGCAMWMARGCCLIAAHSAVADQQVCCSVTSDATTTPATIYG
jgi:hypothetical protein